MQFLLLMPPRSSRRETARQALAGPSHWLLTALSPHRPHSLGPLSWNMPSSWFDHNHTKGVLCLPLKALCVGSPQIPPEPGAEMLAPGVLILPRTHLLRACYVPTTPSKSLFASLPYFLKHSTHLFKAHRHCLLEPRDLPHSMCPRLNLSFPLITILLLDSLFQWCHYLSPTSETWQSGLLPPLFHLVSWWWPYFVIFISVPGL